MKKLVLLFAACIFLTAFQVNEKLFTGKIYYKYTFTDLQGNNINEQLEPYLGKEQNYFIDASNYKSYNQDKLCQLYHSNTNSYYYITDNTAKKMDGSQVTSQKFIVTHLDKTEKVAGFVCKSLQVETDDATTVYYYSPEVKTDKKVFAKHNFGEWNKYLEATNGALALKFIMTNKKNGFIWTSTAMEIVKMELAAKDFAMPDNVQIKE